IQSEIRIVRSAMALWAVSDIDVDNPEITWTPENPEEATETDIFSFRLSRRPLSEAPLIKHPVDLLVRCILARSQYASYEIPLDFYRRAGEDIYEQRYLEAIYDLFFILEYLFGKGTFTKRALKHAFGESKSLNDAIRNAQAYPLPELAN